MAELTLATRGSKLALAQASLVARTISERFPGTDVNLMIVETSGDRDQTSSVTQLTELGAFVRSVQEAVLQGRADLAVHSTKDLPVIGPTGLVGYHPKRAVAGDVLVGASLQDLSAGAVVGTGSPRRSAQLQLLKPELKIVGVRGNIDSRIAKADSGRLTAVVLAEAGLQRANLADNIAYRFTLEEMVPAPGQGALTIEAREGTFAAEVAGVLEDPSTRRTVNAERALLAVTGAGCRSALGAFAEEQEGRILITGFVSDDSGQRFGSAVGDAPASAAQALQVELGL